MGAPRSFEDTCGWATDEKAVKEEWREHSASSSSSSSSGDHAGSSSTINCSYDSGTNNVGMPVWRSPSRVVAFSSIFLFLVVAGVCGHALPRFSGSPSAAAPQRRLQLDPCGEFPSIKIEKILANNLGGYGPEILKPPGMVFEVSMSNVGLTQTKAHLRIDTFTPYVPNWVPSNGLHGEWIAVNVKPGTSVGLVANFYDPEADKNLTIPRGFMTISDIDAGRDNEREFATVSNFFQNYFIGDQSKVQVEEHILTTTFWGIDAEMGFDNPEQNAVLTAVQKKKSVTLQFGQAGLQAAVFKIGSYPGRSAREVRFGFEPTMLCSRTFMPNAQILDALETGQGNIFPKANGREVVKDLESFGICKGNDCDS